MRNLKKAELDLIAALLQDKSNLDELIKLPHLMVEEMDDGGMGSLRFVSKTAKSFGRDIGGFSVSDLDGVPVFFSINLDAEGKLFELDVFKADFSKLKKFPQLPYTVLESY